MYPRQKLLLGPDAAERCGLLFLRSHASHTTIQARARAMMCPLLAPSGWLEGGGGGAAGQDTNIECAVSNGLTSRRHPKLQTIFIPGRIISPGQSGKAGKGGTENPLWMVISLSPPAREEPKEPAGPFLISPSAKRRQPHPSSSRELARASCYRCWSLCGTTPPHESPLMIVHERPPLRPLMVLFARAPLYVWVDYAANLDRFGGTYII